MHFILPISNNFNNLEGSFIYCLFSNRLESRRSSNTRNCSARQEIYWLMNHTEIYEYASLNDKSIFMASLVIFIDVAPYFTFYGGIFNGLHVPSCTPLGEVERYMTKVQSCTSSSISPVKNNTNINYYRIQCCLAP